jgi:uncharacterized protein YeaO (DUF488 family)
VSKDDVKLNRWLKEIAPTTRLRKWFAHDPAKWDEFKRRYGQELERRADEIAALRKHAEDGRLTLVYAAKDREHNNAAALKEYLQRD